MGFAARAGFPPRNLEGQPAAIVNIQQPVHRRAERQLDLVAFVRPVGQHSEHLEPDEESP
jgi:hypothetical protein